MNKTTGRKFSDAENAIVRDGTLKGRTCREIAEALQAAGFTRSPHSINGTKAYSVALVDRKEMAAEKVRVDATKAQTEHVVYDGMILRREVRTVTTQSLNGITAHIPISLSAGVGWQASA